MIRNFSKMIKGEFKRYNAAFFGKDVLAGITVAAVALPLALAFGVSSGASAAAGLVTAILAGLLIGGLSGGSYQISGPTGAMAAILISLMAQYGLQGVFLACFMSGFILLAAGIFRLGNLISYIPAPVITGFTSGIAIIIAIGQIDNLSGLKGSGENVIEKIASYLNTPQQINITSLIIGLSVVLFMFLYPKKLTKYCPASLLAIIIVTALNVIFKFNVASVGEIPKTLFLSERLSLSSISLDSVKGLIVPSVSIAALGFIESLLCGAVAGKMKNEKLDSGIELVAQGIGNMVIPFFGGVPATAAIARTSVAIKSGCRTRVTSIVHSVVLLLSMFILAPIMSMIPLCALAGVLVVTAWRMNEWETIINIHKKKHRSSIFQFLITMIATVIFDLTAAIMIGVICSVIMFVVRVSDMQISVCEVDKDRIGKTFCPGHERTDVVYITGPLYFGTVSKLTEKISGVECKDAIIFSMRGVPFADLSGIQVLEELCVKLKSENVEVYFSGVQPKVMEQLRRCDIINEIGEENFFWSADLALEKIAGKAAV